MTTAILLVGALTLAAYIVTAVVHWWQGIDERIDAMVQTALTVDDDYEQHVNDALAVCETPIYPATAAFIAAQAAVTIEDEWAEIADGGWSR